MLTLDAFERSPKMAELKVSYRSRTRAVDRRTVRVPRDVVDYLRAVWDRHTIELTEHCLVVCLNAAHHPIGWVKVASGGFSSASVDLRLVFGVAVQTASSAIVLAHNHPSGSLEPSPEDIRLTRRLKDAGELLGIKVLDHIILTRDGSVSLAEHGLV